ncbi:MAG: hypothetical protein DRR42_27735 [Gammaproteobacteria bacterium]|nr:MAG: hypothetical protein DRR42_27735 [Gammaproteobacteria bacterium]
MHILIFSLLMLFQPASWAFGTPMFTHQQMDDQSTHSMILITAVAGHCQTHNPKTTQAGSHTNDSDQQGSYMQVGCLAASSSAANLTDGVNFCFEPQHFDVVYYTPENSFHSHTESPEIRPPLNMHFLG